LIVLKVFIFFIPLSNAPSGSDLVQDFCEKQKNCNTVSGAVEIVGSGREKLL